jgi:hypothetical protein
LHRHRLSRHHRTPSCWFQHPRPGGPGHPNRTRPRQTPSGVRSHGIKFVVVTPLPPPPGNDLERRQVGCVGFVHHRRDRSASRSASSEHHVWLCGSSSTSSGKLDPCPLRGRTLIRSVVAREPVCDPAERSTERTPHWALTHDSDLRRP